MQHDKSILNGARYSTVQFARNSNARTQLNIAQSQTECTILFRRYDVDHVTEKHRTILLSH